MTIQATLLRDTKLLTLSSQIDILMTVFAAFGGGLGASTALALFVYFAGPVLWVLFFLPIALFAVLGWVTWRIRSLMNEMEKVERRL